MSRENDPRIATTIFGVFWAGMALWARLGGGETWLVILWSCVAAMFLAVSVFWRPR